MADPEAHKQRRQEWENAVLALKLDADKLQDPLAAFARTTFIEILKSEGNHVIWGRRGTGKTHLLRCLEAELKADFDTRGVMPIYVNGEAFKVNSGNPGSSPSFVAISLYVTLMAKVAEHLEHQIRSRLTPGWRDKLSRRGQIKLGKRALRVSAGLHELLSKGQVRILPLGVSTVEAKTIDEAERSLKAGIDTSLNLSDLRHSGITAEAGANAKSRRARSDITTLRYHSEIIIPFSEVALRFKHLLDLLQDSVGRPVSLVILFDEWSAVHPQSEVQPFLAELIKLTLMTLNASIKLACIPGRTKLLTRITPGSVSPTGMEMAEDITAPVDLDLPCFMGIDPPQLLSFFVEVLGKQIGSRAPWVASMGTGDLTDFVCNNLFVDRDAFAELCQAATFIPRDFLNLLQVATVRAHDSDGTSLEGRISSVHVRQAALSLYNLKEVNFGGAASPALLLLSKIFSTTIGPNESYFFLVSDKMVTHPLIEDLYTGKLIHRLPARYYDQRTYRGYTYFMFDYCAAINVIGAAAAILVMLANTFIQMSANWLNDAIDRHTFFSREDPQSRALFMAAQEDFKRAAKTGRLDVEPVLLIVDDSVFPELPSTT
jgi:hypothetical protein